MNLCDKCDKDIHKVAEGIISGPPLSPIIAPPSPDMPWVSKIPRPCPMENPEVSRLKSATSTGNLSLSQRSKSPGPVMQRSKSNLEPSPNKFTPAPSMSSSYSAGDKKSLIPKFSPSQHRKTPESSTTPKISSPLAETKSFIPRVVTPPALRKMFPKTGENKILHSPR